MFWFSFEEAKALYNYYLDDGGVVVAAAAVAVVSHPGPY